jgi:hypothetical protein
VVTGPPLTLAALRIELSPWFAKKSSSPSTRTVPVDAHSRGPLPPLAMIRLTGVTAETVPSGTELWLDEYL